MPKKVICFKAKFEAINNVLEELLPHGKLKIEELAKETDQNIAWLNNVIPIMAELGLVYRGFDKNIGIIGITHKGIELIDLLEEGNEKKIREFGEKIYRNSDILKIAKKIISENPDIKTGELGKKIADGLKISEEDRWKNETTYVVVARSCKSILGGLKLIDYQPIKCSRFNVDRFRNKIMPYASTIILDKIIKKFQLQKNDTYELKTDNLTQYQRQRQTDYFNTAIMLGLVERVPGNEYRYKLTDDGKKLKEVHGFSEHAMIFQEILLKNPHVVEIIKTIKNNYDEIGSEEIGSIVGEYNKSTWGKGTKISYGNNFLNWLLEADIMVKRGRKHKNTFQPHFLESDNYKRFIEDKTDRFITTTEKIKRVYKNNNVEKKQTVKLLHKTLSLDTLDNEGLLNKLIVEIDILLYDKVENWDNREYCYQKIIEIYDKLMLNMDNEYRLLKSASDNFNKGYKNKDKDLLRNAQENNTYLLENARFKG